MKNIKYYLFHAGIIIMSLTLLFEHLFNGENNVTGFLKGFACGLEIVGVFVLAKNKKFNNQ